MRTKALLIVISCLLAGSVVGCASSADDSSTASAPAGQSQTGRKPASAQATGAAAPAVAQSPAGVDK